MTNRGKTIKPNKTMTKYEIAVEIQKLKPNSCVDIIYETFTKKELEMKLESAKNHYKKQLLSDD